jgi:predicted  nucleic acid-binding Zn-ribbon protein
MGRWPGRAASDWLKDAEKEYQQGNLTPQMFESALKEIKSLRARVDELSRKLLGSATRVRRKRKELAEEIQRLESERAALLEELARRIARVRSGAATVQELQSQKAAVQKAFRHTPLACDCDKCKALDAALKAAYEQGIRDSVDGLGTGSLNAGGLEADGLGADGPREEA